MLARVLNYLVGYERLRNRGDQLFLSGEFHRARREYAKARSVLTRDDYRWTTIESLMRQCDHQAGVSTRALDLDEAESGDEDSTFHPGIDDLFELAVADKDSARLAKYRVQSEAFKAGYVALVTGDAERAVPLLRDAAASTGASFIVHLELGRAESMLGDMAAARESLELAERGAEGDSEVAILLAAVNIELGRYEEARVRLEAVSARDDANPDVSFLSGKALAGLSRNDAALDKFRETVRMEPNFHEAFFEGALVLGKMGDREAQFELLDRAAGLAPDEVRYNRELAIVVLAEHLDEEVGLAACDRLMVSDEDNAWEYLYWIAQLYVRRGWRNEARDPLEKALRLVPHDRSHERREIESTLASL